MKVEYEKIKEIFIETFELTKFKIEPNSQFEEVPGWDSLGHMKLITNLEEEFEIELGIDEIIGVDTVQKILELVQKKIKND